MLRTRVRAGALTGFVMSVVFAMLLTLVQIGDTMIPQLAPHFGAPAPITIRVPYASFIEKGSTASIGYEHTRVMVPRGTMLDENDDADRHYSIEDVPFVQFFDKAVALHGAFWHRDFGHVHSHGCVNLAPLDARWLFGWTAPHMPGGWAAVFPSRVERGTAVRVR